MTRSAGIDVGGTKCLAVLLDDDDNVIASERVPTPHASKLADTLSDLLASLGDFDTVGVGVPGLITPQGVIRSSPNLSSAVELPLGDQLRSMLSVPVTVDNDATSAAYGEWKVGAARGATDVWMVTLGTGIGGGLVSGGVVQRGAHGFAGEVGHIVVEIDGELCPCGLRGCWERYASGTALSRLAGGERGEDVIDRARRGEADALAVVDRFARYVAVGLVSLTNATDPDVLVIGGGVIASSEVVMPAIASHFSSLLYAPEHRPHPRLVSAQLGEKAGAIGAALLGRQ
ncbi:MAG: glucokinase [Actinomycetota bacterium]